jgi:hypothetical protein
MCSPIEGGLCNLCTDEFYLHVQGCCHSFYPSVHFYFYTLSPCFISSFYTHLFQQFNCHLLDCVFLHWHSNPIESSFIQVQVTSFNIQSVSVGVPASSGRPYSEILYFCKYSIENFSFCVHRYVKCLFCLLIYLPDILWISTFHVLTSHKSLKAPNV